MTMRVHIIDIISHGMTSWEQSQRMIELERLVTTYGWLVIIKTMQKKDIPAYRTYIGKWKLNMIVEDMIATESDILIIGNILKPAQIYNINEVFREHPLIKDSNIKIEAWDKVDLILKIFDKHAQSTEAKLQIELAAIKHMWPRIFGMGMEMSKQGWGASGSAGAWRWLWETNTERMRRHLKEKAYSIEQKLKEYSQMRSLHRERRKKMNLPVFGIVWYTNAGKSSLMRTMCKKEAYVADKLFATLGTEVGKLYIQPEPQEGAYVPGQEVLLIDTIGFIRDLPPQLIKAFASTLEDSIQSDILLHVIDAHDPDLVNKVQIVEDILHQIKAKQPMIYVFNKSDEIDDKKREMISDQYYGKDVVFVSALTGEWLPELQEKMLKILP